MISIVVPCYNSDKTLQTTVNRLCRQTAHNFQIILVDDGSTDKTPAMCDDLAENDPRIKVIHQDNRGLMGAWKSGVLSSDGDYIAFCDSDDYVDYDLIEKITEVQSKYAPDIVLYGMIVEYSNGDSVRSFNRLGEGYYDEKQIKNEILPKLLSDGSMQSELIIKSRCAKAIRKDTLLTVLDDLNDKVSVGEDQLTTFAVIQIAKSIYCIGDYSPYHYIRTTDSMIGRFDPDIFEKVDLLYNEMNRIADLYLYPYKEQIMYARLSSTLLYVKKYICKSDDGYKQIKRKIEEIRLTDDFREIADTCSLANYSLSSRIFAKMLISGRYAILYVATKLLEKISGRGV